MHWAIILLCILAVVAPAQSRRASEAFEQDRRQAHALLRDGKYAEAGKLFTSLSKKAPGDFDVLFHNGYAHYLEAETISDEKKQRALRKIARESMLKAQEAGFTEPLISELLLVVKPDGSKVGGAFTPHVEADASMRKGEMAFSRKAFDEARSHYLKALELDPKLYGAAVFLGDVEFAQNRYAEAIGWFEKAVAINPDQDTAYRYWGDALVRSGAPRDAGDKYILAVVANPSSALAWRSLEGWGTAHGLTPQHPAQGFARASVSVKDGKIELNVDSQGGIFSTVYGLMRAAPITEALAKKTTYQHGLKEELHCLQGVMEIADAVQTDPAKAKDTNVTEAMLRDVRTVRELTADSLLESWIFFVRGEPSMAGDYAACRNEHRDRLQRYLHDVFLQLPAAAAATTAGAK